MGNVRNHWTGIRIGDMSHGFQTISNSLHQRVLCDRAIYQCGRGTKHGRQNGSMVIPNPIWSPVDMASSVTLHCLVHAGVTMVACSERPVRGS